MLSTNKRTIKAFAFDLGNTLINDAYLAKNATIDMSEWLFDNSLIQSKQAFVASFERINEILESKPQIVDHDRAHPLPPVKGHVQFEKVSFSYNENIHVLDNVDFEILPKEKVALIGLSGAGKTTIVNLMSGLLKPTSGTVQVCGIDVTKAVERVRKVLGVVPSCG